MGLFTYVDPGEYPEKPKNTENIIHFSGWNIRKENDKFYIDYMSETLHGKENTIEISKEDFYLTKDGKYTLDQLSIKYDFS